MARIAFVTCSTKPGFASDDLLAVSQLHAAGVTVQPVPWDSDFLDWKSFDKVILRSCWNYHLQPEKFLLWLQKMEEDNIPLFNSSKTVRWNLHKNYLRELQNQKVLIPETDWLTKGKQAHLKNLMNGRKWSKAVVKPAISATAYNTFLISIEDAENYQGQLNSLLATSDLLVQRFVPEVQQEGEWSLIFFNKNFSHAILKKPKERDFRVQNDFGGSVHNDQAPESAIAQAKKILHLVNDNLLYARVDGVISNEKFILMELELIEPVLFLEHSPQAAFAFVKAILN